MHFTSSVPLSTRAYVHDLLNAMPCNIAAITIPQGDFNDIILNVWRKMCALVGLQGKIG